MKAKQHVETLCASWINTPQDGGAGRGGGQGGGKRNWAREKEQKQSFRRVICLIQQSCEKRLGKRGGGKEGKDG